MAAAKDDAVEAEDDVRSSPSVLLSVLAIVEFACGLREERAGWLRRDEIGNALGTNELPPDILSMLRIELPMAKESIDSEEDEGGIYSGSNPLLMGDINVAVLRDRGPGPGDIGVGGKILSAGGKETPPFVLLIASSYRDPSVGVMPARSVGSVPSV